jgi:hypothetical protein
MCLCFVYCYAIQTHTTRLPSDFVHINLTCSFILSCITILQGKLLHAPNSTVHFFFIIPTTYAHYFGIVCQYLLPTVLILRTDIPHAFSSYACSMSILTYSFALKYLRILLNTLSRNNLYSYLCAYQQKSSMLSKTCTPHVHLTMGVLTVKG